MFQLHRPENSSIETFRKRVIAKVPCSLRSKEPRVMMAKKEQP